jgi:hypothetical protein
METPVTSSPIVAGYLSNLPAYRTGVAPLLRGVEIGLAHGLLVNYVYAVSSAVALFALLDLWLIKAVLPLTLLTRQPQVLHSIYRLYQSDRPL